MYLCVLFAISFHWCTCLSLCVYSGTKFTRINIGCFALRWNCIVVSMNVLLWNYIRLPPPLTLCMWLCLWMFKLVAFENYFEKFCVWYPSTHGFLYWYMSQNCILWYAIFLYIPIARSILIIKMPFLRFAYKKVKQMNLLIFNTIHA